MAFNACIIFNWRDPLRKISKVVDPRATRVFFGREHRASKRENVLSSLGRKKTINAKDLLNRYLGNDYWPSRRQNRERLNPQDGREQYFASSRSLLSQSVRHSLSGGAPRKGAMRQVPKTER
jgi:hypothetical protein